MRCDNCGGVMRLVENRDYFYCPYCSNVFFPKDIEESADGLKPLGAVTALECPTCEEGLLAGSIDGHRVCYCEKCRGILVTSSDFREIIQQRRSTHHGTPTEMEPLKREELNRRIKCPKCGAVMETHPYYGPGNVVIDSCGDCMLVWLDSGEIGSLERAPGPG